MQRGTTADDLFDAHHSLGDDALDVDDLITGAQREIDRLADGVAQALHIGQRAGAQVEVERDARGELTQFRAQQVASPGITLDKAYVTQRCEDAERGGGVKTRLGGQDFQRSRVALADNRIEQRTGALNDLYGCHFTI